MATTNWNGATGDWGKAADWSAGVPDSAKAKAEIAASGAYTVTIGASEAFTVGSLAVDAAGATVAIDGALTVGKSLDLAAGAITLSSLGVIHGGELFFDGGTLASSSGTLDGVHVVGTLALPQQFAWLNVTNGLDLTTADGGAGTVSLTGDFGVIEFKGSQTFDNATISLGSWTGFLNGDFILNTGKLTLGAHVTVVSSSLHASATIGGATVINDGAIEAFAPEGIFLIDPKDFINNASVASDGDTLEITARNVVNAAGGVIDIGAGENGYFGGASSTVVNEGLISVGVGATLLVNGQYTLAGLGTIANQGAILLQGELMNQGATVTLGSGVLDGNVTVGGAIVGGVVDGEGDDGNQLQAVTLDGVAYEGPLTLSSQFASLTVENGLTVTPVGHGGPGAVNIDGDGAAMFFSGSQTFDNAVVRLGGGGDGDALTVVGPGKSRTTTLTLGANLEIISAGAKGDASIDGTFPARGLTSVVNDGRIIADAAGGQFSIDPGDFVNNGSIAVEGGDDLQLTPLTSLANNGSITVEGHATATIGVFEAPFSNAGSISVGAKGALTVDGDYTVASLGNLVDAGVFIIGGTLDNSGSTLELGTGPIFGGGESVLEGVIEGGTVAAGQGLLSYRFGTLENLFFQGVADLKAAGEVLNLEGGVAFTGAGGTGGGLIQLTGAGATLQFTDPKGLNAQTIDNVEITAGNAGTAAVIDIFSDARTAQTLTFGAGASIVSATAGALVAVNGGLDRPDVIINDGSIDASGQGGLFTVTAGTFQNNGQVTVAKGDTFVVAAAVTGSGGMTVASGGTLELGGAAAAQTITFKDAAGSLKLTDAAAFAATIAGAQVGDAIDLVETAATSASVNGADQLVVADNGVTVAQLQLVGNYAQTQFSVGSDGAGGSVITLSNAAVPGPAVRNMAQAMAALAAHGGPIAETIHSVATRMATPVLARPLV